MLTISKLSTLPHKPISSSNLISLLTNPNFPPLLSKRFYVFEKPPMSSSKVVAEYAKSSRSTCKKCAKPISASALRLGLVSRDSRGFDMTKWHHLDCFPIDSDSLPLAKTIKGFSSLKSSDQEAVKVLVGGRDQSLDEVSDGDNDVLEGSKKRSSKRPRVHKADVDEENEPVERNLKKTQVSDGDNDVLKGSKKRSSKRPSVHKADVDEENEPVERNLKKTQLSTRNEETEVDIAFSISDIKDKYKDATLLPKWKAFQTIIFLEQDDGLHDSRKIAAFDFDGCLVKTSVKRVGPDAWSLMYPSIADKLQNLYNDGYKLVVFTNESNIERWKNKRQVAVDSKIGRLNNFIKHVKVPIQVFIACGLGKSKGQAEDPFRKPKPGMWRIMEQHFNSGISIDMDQSFYVGDAAGRPNDHSDADIKFAQTIGLKFYLPEEYFSV